MSAGTGGDPPASFAAAVLQEGATPLQPHSESEAADLGPMARALVQVHSNTHTHTSCVHTLTHVVVDTLTHYTLLLRHGIVASHTLTLGWPLWDTISV